jgi:hypothetical protein
MITVVLQSPAPITMDTLTASASAEERPWDRAHALAGLAPYLDAGRRDRVLDIAMELPDAHSRNLLIGELLPFLEAGRLATVIGSATTDLLTVLGPRLSRQRQQDLIEGLLAEAETGQRDAGSLTTLRPVLSTDQAGRIGRLLLAGDDPRQAIGALRPWVPKLPAEVRSAALTLVRADCADDWTLARVLVNEWIAHLSEDEARQLLPVVSAFERNARAEVLPALAAVLPEAAPAAVDALRHGRGTGQGIAALARVLSPAARGELLAVLAAPPAEDLPGPAHPSARHLDVATLRPLAPLLDEGQLGWVLRLCEAGPNPHGWLDAAALCLPHLSEPLRAEVQNRVVEQMTSLGSIRPLPQFIGPLRDEQHDGVDVPRQLLPAGELLREEQYQALIPLALTLPAGDAVGLIVLAHKLDRGQRDAALGTVGRLHPHDQRPILVRALAPFLDDDQIETAATLPGLAGADPGCLFDMMIALAAATVGAGLHTRLTDMANAIAETMSDRFRRACAMVTLAAVCRPEAARQRALRAAIRLLPELDHGERCVIRRDAAELLRVSSTGPTG